MTEKNKHQELSGLFSNPLVQGFLVVVSIICIATKGYQFGQFVHNILN